MKYCILTFTGQYNVSIEDIQNMCLFINTFVNNAFQSGPLTVEDEYKYYLFNSKIYKVKDYELNKIYNIQTEDIITDVQIIE